MCIADFEFFLIDSLTTKGLHESVNGVLGLARNMPHYLSAENDEVTIRGPSYLHALKNAELITEATFAFASSPADSTITSSIDFGPHDPSKIKDDSKLEWIDVNDDFFWSAKC